MAVPMSGGTINIRLEFGGSTVIIGANGSGKTRLGVHIEEALSNKDIVHRIAAQRMLTIDEVSLIAFELAETALRYGNPQAVPVNRRHYRWQNKPAIQLLNDFQALLQTLFAQQNRAAVQFLEEHRKDPTVAAPVPVLHRVQEVWHRLLPHRELHIFEASIVVKPIAPSSGAAATPPDSYKAAEMSDGERAIFYLLGQCLIARPGSILVVDEPEAHVHKAIANQLWDTIEAERPDCAFVYFTHDLDFASRRTARSKYFVRSFSQLGGKSVWEIEEVPSDPVLPEHVVSEIVGSRRPILFVEGTGASLDVTVCRGVYADFTVIPIGSCDDVIHSVESFRQNKALLAAGPARGLIDADSRTAEEIALLGKLDVYVLPVAEIENLLLLPDVFIALAEALPHTAPLAAELLQELTDRVVTRAKDHLDAVSTRHAIRRLDSRLKRVGLAAKDLPTLQTSYSKEISAVDPASIFAEAKGSLEKCIQSRDLAGLLSVYDNKGLLAEAASVLRLRNRSALEDLITRLVSSPTSPRLRDVLAAAMPSIAF